MKMLAMPKGVTPSIKLFYPPRKGITPTCYIRNTFASKPLQTHFKSVSLNGRKMGVAQTLDGLARELQRVYIFNAKAQGRFLLNT